jgi:AmmeMemoRadiSam system protein B
MSTTSAIREPLAAGDFYPADKTELKEYVTSLLETKGLPRLGVPYGLVTPMSPYKVAGSAYAASYSQLKGQKIDTVVIISPLHKMSFDGLCFTGVSGYSTPLGEVQVDKECNDFLAGYHEKYCIVNDEYHAAEVAVEVQLPFLQTIFGKKVTIVPVIIGEPNTKITLLLARAIAAMSEKYDRKYLFVAASDLSKGVSLDTCREKDAEFIKFFEQNHGDHLSEAFYMKQFIAFGGGGIVSLQRLSEIVGGKKTKVLMTDNSSTVTDDPYHVDGYCSAMWW